MKPKLLFYCQHVLGMGHLVRTFELIRQLDHFDVYLLFGGEPNEWLALPDCKEIIYLPALKSDAEFTGLQSPDVMLGLEAIQEQRKDLILAALRRIRPTVIVIELFPFGRLKFAFELLPLLAAAKQLKTKVVCSVRDILVSKSNQASFEIDAVSILNQSFDLLLIHSDPKFQRLDETFARCDEIKIPFLYTGFVAAQPEKYVDRPPHWLPSFPNERKIIVSIGGGRVGTELLETAIEASVQLQLEIPHQMLILTGPYFPAHLFTELTQRVSTLRRVQVAMFSNSFTGLLTNADLSISMAGYNTCMNLISCGVRALLYPFTGHGNQEQSMRAAKLAQLGLAQVLDPEKLSATKLADAIRLSLRAAPPKIANQLDLNGARHAARSVEQLIHDH